MEGTGSHFFFTIVLPVAVTGLLPYLSPASVDFEKQILPIFQEKCFSCHSGRIKYPKAGIRLDMPQAILKGNEYGPVIAKMQPEESVLYQRISLPPGQRGIMPPVGKGEPCTPEQLKIIHQWIKKGARFGEWTGIEKNKPAATRRALIKNSRLSSQNYGTEKGLQMDLAPNPRYRTRLSASLIEAKAAEIDQLVETHRKTCAGKLQVSYANDRVFVRRIYLGIVGRTPTHDEAVAFLSSRDPQKRTKLIDRLIATEGYVNGWFHFWADLLKVKTTRRFISSVYYGEWIKQALRDNMPYNQFAYELITATGMPYQNGATGWTASDENMAPDHMANTMQAFLGMQLQCAQCHDHPFDRWNQYEFQSLVSFFGGVHWNGVNNKHFIRKIEKAGLDISVKQEKYFGNSMSYRYRHAVWEPQFGRWNRLPEDYQYVDGKPGQFVLPQVIFGHQPVIKDSPREAFGKWLTDRENQWFTVAIVNRLWRRTMGVGLIEPVDNIKYDTQAKIPELLALLEENMKEIDYNLKDFLRILYNTKTWQLAALTEDLPEDLADYHYEGRPLMRMTGEQIWDSLVALAIVDSDDRKGHGSRYTSEEYRRHTEEIYFMPIHELVALYTDEYINQEKREYKEAQKTAIKIFHSKKTRRQPRKYGASFTSWSFDHMTDPRWHGMDRGLVRAAELTSPAPAYHFIRQFGQSDRNIIGVGRTDPNVTQVLNMLNGPIHYILDSELSVLSKQMAKQKSPEEKIGVIFRSVLTRNPSKEDMEIASEVLMNNLGRQGCRMILWALLNTREFIYIQ